MPNDDSSETKMHRRAKELFKKEFFAKDAWNAPPGSGISAKYAIDVASRAAARSDAAILKKDSVKK